MAILKDPSMQALQVNIDEDFVVSDTFKTGNKYLYCIVKAVIPLDCSLFVEMAGPTVYVIPVNWRLSEQTEDREKEVSFFVMFRHEEGFPAGDYWVRGGVLPDTYLEEITFKVSQ